MIVVTIEQIKEQAVSLKRYLSKRTTVYDFVGTYYDGYDECDTIVVIDEKEYTVGEIFYSYFKGDIKKLKNANIKIQAIRVMDRDASDIFKFGICAATYNYVTGEFVFDVGDVNYNHTENILENVGLHNVESEFKKALEKERR